MKNYKTIQEVRDCEELTEIEKVQIQYYEDIASLSEALEHYTDVYVQETQAIDYATEIFNEIYSLSDNILRYIDYKSFCNDLLIEGEIYQFNYKYLITNANSI